MKIKAELYGDKIGVDNNLERMIRYKECGILLTINDDKMQHKVVLNRDDANSLVDQLVSCFKEAVDYGFSVV
jgi:hypothetical protein